jgi:hypothetical protein
VAVRKGTVVKHPRAHGIYSLWDRAAEAVALGQILCRPSGPGASSSLLIYLLLRRLATHCGGQQPLSTLHDQQFVAHKPLRLDDFVGSAALANGADTAR